MRICVAGLTAVIVVILLTAFVTVSGCGSGEEEELKLSPEEAAADAAADATTHLDAEGTVGSPEQFGLQSEPESAQDDQDAMETGQPD